MDRPEKALLAVPLLALAVWRFIRYMQFGSRVHQIRRSASAQGSFGVPNISGSLRTSSTAVRVAAATAAVIVWVGGNVLLWLALFQLPFERDLPFIWPLFLAIFANFYLVPFAGRSGRKWAQRFEPDSSVVS
jgi:hypothetical protein